MNKKAILIAAVLIIALVAGTFLTQGDLFQGRLAKDKGFKTRPPAEQPPAAEYSPIVLTIQLQDDKEYLPRLYWTDSNPAPDDGNPFTGTSYNVYKSSTSPVEFVSQNLLGTVSGINFNDFPTEIGTYYYAVEIAWLGAGASRSNEVSTTLTEGIKWGPPAN